MDTAPGSTQNHLRGGYPGPAPTSHQQQRDAPTRHAATINGTPKKPGRGASALEWDEARRFFFRVVICIRVPPRANRPSPVGMSQRGRWDGSTARSLVVTELSAERR